jgi:hypothetical protein
MVWGPSARRIAHCEHPETRCQRGDEQVDLDRAGSAVEADRRFDRPDGRCLVAYYREIENPRFVEEDGQADHCKE